MLKNMTGIAVVRSLVQFALASLLSTAFGERVVTFVTTNLGWELDTEWVVTTSSLFLFGIVVWLVNKLGANFAWINQLISLGMSRTGPGYVTNDADAVVIEANAGAADTVTTIDIPPPGPNKYDEGFNPGDPGYDEWKANNN